MKITTPIVLITLTSLTLMALLVGHLAYEARPFLGAKLAPGDDVSSSNGGSSRTIHDDLPPPLGLPTALGSAEALKVLYNPQSWDDLLHRHSNAEFEEDRLELLAAVSVACSAGSIRISRSPPLSLEERKSRSIVAEFTREFCNGFDARLVDEQLAPLRDISTRTAAWAEEAELPMALDGVQSAARFQRIGAANSHKPLNMRLERDLGVERLSQERQEAVRTAAIVVARCQLFPGCAPTSPLTIGACAPRHCVPGQTFSDGLIEDSLTPREQIMARHLATYIVHRRNSAERGRK